MNKSADHNLLVEALHAARKLQRPGATLLSLHSEDMLNALALGIDRCDAYKAVANHILFSAGSGMSLQSTMLAKHFAYKIDDDADQSAEWLLHVLSTRKASGFFKAAIWGLTVSKDVDLGNGARLVPFAQLPSSYGRQQMEQYSKRPMDGSVWLSQQYWNVPGAVYVQRVADFPYILPDNSAFEVVRRLRTEARRTWTLLEVVGAGHPLVFGSWFEYEDSSIDLEKYSMYLTWSHPEIAPRIRENTAAPERLEMELETYGRLPAEFQNVLMRSADRFALSQCRREHTDRILDLALAFEIATSGKSAALPGWRVSVRAAQMIGGSLAQRKNHRAKVGEFYRRRNALTHGSRGDDMTDMKTWSETWEVIVAAAEIYLLLFKSFLRLGRLPDWDDIELQPAFVD